MRAMRPLNLAVRAGSRSWWHYSLQAPMTDLGGDHVTYFVMTPALFEKKIAHCTIANESASQRMTHLLTTVTYIGGPTVVLEINGVRLLTDPTFDPAPRAYALGAYTLRKLTSPAIPVTNLGRNDAVLLSHDHHVDNLDHEGRALLRSAGKVFTTIVGAERLGNGAVGLAPWQAESVVAEGGQTLRITAVPAQHGPAGQDRGPVIGFIVTAENADGAVYISGDTVWFDALTEISNRFQVRIAILFMGAARVKEVSLSHLTFTAEQAIKAARAFKDATIVPVHFEGWEHFTESKEDIVRAFVNAGLAGRLLWPRPGEPTPIASARPTLNRGPS